MHSSVPRLDQADDPSDPTAALPGMRERSRMSSEASSSGRAGACKSKMLDDLDGIAVRIGNPCNQQSTKPLVW